jgi:hypothetical protein
VSNELPNDGKNHEKIAAKKSSGDAAAQGKPDPSIFHDLWQAAKYSAVQESYDGLSQLANHFGATVAERKLEDRPSKPTSELDSVAQTIGYGIGKAPGLAAIFSPPNLVPQRSLKLLPARYQSRQEQNSR